MLSLCSFQNSVKPKTTAWLRMMELSHVLPKKKKKKAKLRQSSSLVCGYYPSGRWPQPCARPRWTHAVGFLSSPRLYVRAGSSSRAAPIYIASLQSVAWGKHVRKTNLCSVSYATTGQLFNFSQSCCSYQYFKGHYHIKSCEKQHWAGLWISSQGNVFEGTRRHSIPASRLLSSDRYKLSPWENTILCMSHWKASSVRHLMIHSPTCWSPHEDDSFCPQEESPGIPKSPHLFQSW